MYRHTRFIKDKVVRVLVGGSYFGTGFFVTSSDILTARHVVEKNHETGETYAVKDISVLISSSLYGIKSMRCCDDADIALLSAVTPSSVFANDTQTFLPIGLSHINLEHGDKVAIWGYPGGHVGSPIVCEGIISGVDDHFLIINGNFPRGMSGGPVIHLNGSAIIGLCKSFLNPCKEFNLENIKDRDYAKIIDDLIGFQYSGIHYAVKEKFINKFLKEN